MVKKKVNFAHNLSRASRSCDWNNGTMEWWNIEKMSLAKLQKSAKLSLRAQRSNPMQSIVPS